MRSEAYLALISKMVEDRVSSIEDNLFYGNRGPRGYRGPQGEPGKDFSWAEYEENIRSLIRESALKFDDLTSDEIEILVGPKGEKGDKGDVGLSGKDFIFEEHQLRINEIISSELRNISPSLKLNFSDLTPEDIAKIRGPRGLRGQKGSPGEPGKNFDWAENETNIFGIINKVVEDLSPKLKLKFDDLSSDEIDLLRGPVGPRGFDGKSFVFEEHKEYFDTLKLKFSDLTEEEIGQLKLKFSDLSLEEIGQLKLKFSDLTEEEKFQLRGARGSRGQRGSKGETGDVGPQGIVGPRGLIGPRGQIGPMGMRGLQGEKGEKGDPGTDAPTIEEFEVVEKGNNEIAFRISLTNGFIYETSHVKLPARPVVNQAMFIAAPSTTTTNVISGGGEDVPETLGIVYRHDCAAIGKAVPADGSSELEIIASTVDEYMSVDITNQTNSTIMVYSGNTGSLVECFLIGGSIDTFHRKVKIPAGTRLSVKSTDGNTISTKKFFLEFNKVAV